MMLRPHIPARQKCARAAARTAATGIARQIGQATLHNMLPSISDITLCSVDLLTNPHAINEALVVFAGVGFREGCGGAPVALRDILQSYEARRSATDRDAQALALLAQLGQVAASSSSDVTILPEACRPAMAELAGLVLTEAEATALRDPSYRQPIIAIVCDGAAGQSLGRIYHSVTSAPASWTSSSVGAPVPSGAARH